MHACESRFVADVLEEDVEPEEAGNCLHCDVPNEQSDLATAFFDVYGGPKKMVSELDRHHYLSLDRTNSGNSRCNAQQGTDLQEAGQGTATFALALILPGVLAICGKVRAASNVGMFTKFCFYDQDSLHVQIQSLAHLQKSSYRNQQRINAPDAEARFSLSQNQKKNDAMTKPFQSLARDDETLACGTASIVDKSPVANSRAESLSSPELGGDIVQLLKQAADAASRLRALAERQSESVQLGFHSSPLVGVGAAEGRGGQEISAIGFTPQRVALLQLHNRLDTVHKAAIDQVR